MNEIYICINITDFGNGKTSCDMCQSVNDGPLERTPLEKTHAQKLLWELVLAGGKHFIHINRADPHIFSSHAYIFLPN